MKTFKKFLNSYIDCAKKTCYISYDSQNPNYEKNFIGIEISELGMLTAQKVCNDFISSAKKIGIDILASDDISQFGYDFWLTRNNHGTGFWDHKNFYGKDSEKLTELAESFGEENLYLGDDGKAYFECLTFPE